MKSGYKVVWTDHAIDGLRRTFEYLELNFSEREIGRLARSIESVLGYISKHPKLYPESRKHKGIRKAVIEKHNTLYYRINRGQIEILSFFSNRQDPERLKL